MAKIVKFNKSWLWIIFIFVFAMGWLVYMMQPGALFDDDSVVYSPDWVSLECSVVNYDVPEEITQFKTGSSPDLRLWDPTKINEYTLIDCDEFTKSCDIDMYFDSSYPEQSGWICGEHNEGFVCDDGAVNCQQIGGIDLSFNGWMDVTVLNPGQELYVRAWYNSGFLCNDVNPIPNNVFKMKKVFDQYGLIIDGDTKLIKREGDCRLSEFADRIKDGVYPSNGELTFTGGEGYSYISFINEWNPMFKGDLYTHPQYGVVYCSGMGSLYQISEEFMENGQKYYFAADVPVFDTEVECCPNMPGCNDDFKFDNQPGECKLTSECPGSGWWYSNGPGESQSWVCEDGQCVKKTMTVECSTPSDCPGGYCDMSSVDPEDWHCESGTPPKTYCGDGDCDPALEDEVSCPVDCFGNENPEEESYLIWVVIGVGLVVVIVVIMTRQKTASGGAF